MGAASSNPPEGCGCGTGASTGKMCVSGRGSDGMPAKREAIEGPGGETTVGAGGAGAGTGGGTEAGGEATAGEGTGGGDGMTGTGAGAGAGAETGASREGNETSSPPLTATHFHPESGSQTLFICPKASVCSTSRKVSCRPAGTCWNGCRGGERREPGRAHSGTGGGDRERERARA